MSGELAAVCASLARADATGGAVVLATVVRVDGSAYRRPGARMVIDGARTVGLVSGGCLEADLAERARTVMASLTSEVVVYDTSAAADGVWGLGLGCDGVVHVLLEPLVGSRLAAVRALHECWRDGDRSIVAGVVIRVSRPNADAPDNGLLRGRAGVRVGDRIVAAPDAGTDVAPDPCATLIASGAWADGDVARAAAVLREAVSAGRSGVHPVLLEGGGTCDVLLEVLTPPPALLVCGAGPDAQPVVRFAAALGWRVTVVDHRPGFVHAERFPGAATVHHVPRETPLGDAVRLDAQTAAVVMSHDYARDLDYLDALVGAGAGYVGLLGPARRRARLWSDLVARRGWAADAPAPPSVHGPAGLDLGGDGPAAIALAIVAEVAAFRHGRSAGTLRERAAGIHADGARSEWQSPGALAAAAA